MVTLEQWETLAARVAILEEQIAEVRQNTGTAHLLARTADREVMEFKQVFKAHTRSLIALRETQVEQGSEIRELRQEMRQGFAKLADLVSGQLAGIKDFHVETGKTYAKLQLEIARITALFKGVSRPKNSTGSADTA